MKLQFYQINLLQSPITLLEVNYIKDLNTIYESKYSIMDQLKFVEDSL